MSRFGSTGSEGPTHRATPGRLRRRQLVDRRWCVPPAMLRDPADRLEGDSILSESPGDFGLLLWKTVRDVRLWAEVRPEARGNLFGRGSVDTRLALLAATAVPPQVSASVDPRTVLRMWNSESSTRVAATSRAPTVFSGPPSGSDSGTASVSVACRRRTVVFGSRCCGATPPVRRDSPAWRRVRMSRARRVAWTFC